MFNFTVRRCLCVGNAERNEVPNHNSTYIRSEKEVEKNKQSLTLSWYA